MDINGLFLTKAANTCSNPYESGMGGYKYIMDINGLFLTKAANALDQRSSCRVTRIWQATDEQRVAVVCYGAVEGEGDAISFAAEGGTAFHPPARR